MKENMYFIPIITLGKFNYKNIVNSFKVALMTITTFGKRTQGKKLI